MNLSETFRKNINEGIQKIPVYRIGQEEYIRSFDPIRLDSLGVNLENIELYKRVDTSEEAEDKINYLIISDVRWDGDPSVSQLTTYNIVTKEWEDEPNPAILGVFDEDLDIAMYDAIKEAIEGLALQVNID